MQLTRSLLLLSALLMLGPAAAAPAGNPGRFLPDPKLPPDMGVPYVILTTDAMAPSFQRLIEWKKGMGLPAQVISVDWLAKSPAYPGLDLPERIYLLLRDLRLNWRTRWVLLGGDIEIVPPQKIRAYRGTHGGNQIASDVYYSDVLPGSLEDVDALDNYGWNGNGDRFIGESDKDGFDLVADLVVGRIPVSTPKEADAFFEKYFEYAAPQGKDLSWMQRAVVVGANEFKDNQTHLRDLFKELGGAGYSPELLIEKKPDPIASISEELNKGCAFFDYLCHGCPAHFWAMDDHTSWGVTQLATLKNEGKYPIVFANSCNTAEFDKSNCLAVAFLTQPKAGGVAYLGYSSVSFQSQVNKEMYKLLFGGACPQLGRALVEAKAKMPMDTWAGQILNLFGDPEMWVRTGAPVSVKTTGERFSHNVPARVTVTDAAGKPIPAARVWLESAGTAETDAAGVALLPPPSKPGSARLSIQAQNAARFEKKVTVDAKPPAGFSRGIARPTLAIDDTADGSEGGLRGNGQKDLNPGETVRFLYHWPKDAAPPKGTWELSLAGNPYMKAAGPGAMVDETTLAFTVQVAPRVPPWHQAWMTLSFREDPAADAWTWTFRQPVEGPVVSCVTCIVDDAEGNKDKRVGWEDAGKKIRFSIGLLNRGTQKANGLKVTVASDDPSVTLLKNSIAFGALICDEPVHPKDKAFEFQLAADYDGHPVAFGLVIEDDRGTKWSGRIVFTVPPAPPVLLRAESGVKNITISWVPGGSAGVVGYHVFRGTSEKGPFTRLTESAIKTGTRYPDPTVKPASPFWYVVTSVTADGLESRFSTPIKGHTLTPLPKGDK